MDTRTLAGAAAVTAAALCLVGSVVVAFSGTEPADVGEPGVRSAASARSTGSGTVAEVRHQGSPSSRDHVRRPAQVMLPALGLALPVRPVGVTPSGEMALPADPAVLGWYRFGSRPGTPGSTVLAGHVDSARFGVGPLVGLHTLWPGDRIEVTSRNGQVQLFRVRTVTLHDRDRLPASLFARTGPSMLRIITCAGEYDAQSGGYQLNLVITAAAA